MMKQQNYRMAAAARLFRAVLLLSKRGYTITELAETLQCSVKTIRRMIEALEAIHIPVIGEHEGMLSGGRYVRWRVDPFWVARWIKTESKGGVSNGKRNREEILF